MRLEQIARLAVGHALGRVLRRGVLMLLVFISTVVAVYQFTVAASLALEMHYDTLHAKLAIGAGYAVIAVVFALVLWAVRQRNGRAAAQTNNLPQQREMQLVM